MVLCSKAAIGTCCTEDRTKRPAWKTSRTNVTVGSSCADARNSFCRSQGTLGSKFCPAAVSSRFPKGFVPNARPVVNSPQCGRTINGKFQCCTGNPPKFKIVQTASRADCCARFGTGGRCFNDAQPQQVAGGGGDAPAAAAPHMQSITEALCPVFQFIPIPDNCNAQVGVGIGLVAVGIIMLFRLLK